MSDDLELDVWWRYVHANGARETLSTSGNIKIEPYSTLNVRLGWRPRKDWELSLIGANLLDKSHLEFVQEAFTYAVEVERSIYGQVKWSF